jgi:hypothetical protein
MGFLTFITLMLQTMWINGHNVTPPLAETVNIPSCLVCLQYRMHAGETDIEARKRMLSVWVKKDKLFANRQKHFVTLGYHDSKGNCDEPVKKVTYKKQEDFPLFDVPIPGCRNVWFVKWEKLP